MEWERGSESFQRRSTRDSTGDADDADEGDGDGEGDDCAFPPCFSVLMFWVSHFECNELSIFSHCLGHVRVFGHGFSV